MAFKNVDTYCVAPISVLQGSVKRFPALSRFALSERRQRRRSPARVLRLLGHRSGLLLCERGRLPLRPRAKPPQLLSPLSATSSLRFPFTHLSVFSSFVSALRRGPEPGGPQWPAAAGRRAPELLPPCRGAGKMLCED